MRLTEKETSYESESQFLYYASIAMRNVVVDNARYWSSQKRGGMVEDAVFDEAQIENIALHSAQQSEEILSLDEALKKLSKTHIRMAEIITCRFFGGLTIDETAETLKISPATLKRDWTLAKALLYQAIS